MVSSVNHSRKTTKPKQANRNQQPHKTQDATSTKSTENQTNSRDLTDRQRGIREEINSNKDRGGKSYIVAQQGDKVGDVVNARLDKDGDGKLSTEETAHKQQYVSDLFSKNDSLKAKAENAGLDLYNTTAENVDKLMALGLDPGEKIYVPAPAIVHDTKKDTEADNSNADPAKDKGACSGGSPKSGESPSASETPKQADATKNAQDAQQQQQTAEALIAQAAQLISQAEAGSAQQGGDPSQLASQAKQLLSQARGMVSQQSQGQGQQNTQGQNMFAQNALTGQAGNQNQMQNINAGAITEQSVQQMQPNQKLQLIQALDTKATQIMQGGGKTAQNNPMDAMNQLAKMISGNSPMNASNNYAAQTLMKPNLPSFQAA